MGYKGNYERLMVLAIRGLLGRRGEEDKMATMPYHLRFLEVSMR